MARPHPPDQDAAMAGQLELLDAARIVGYYRWTEVRLFEVMGRWVTSVAEPEVKLLLSEHSYHHAWHAELWSDRLPELHDLDPDQFMVPASATLEAFMQALADPTRTIERLVGVYRVLLPRMAGTYQAHLDRASAITDAPAMRALRLVLADEVADWQQGERMIQRLLATGADVQRAVAHQAALEALIVMAGGITGGGIDQVSPRGS